MSHEQKGVPQLELVREARIAELLGGSGKKRLEASGVLAKDGFFHVVFDSLPYLGLIEQGLLQEDGHNRLVKLVGGHGKEYEDIAYDRSANCFYVLIEALSYGSRFMATVEKYDENFRLISSGPLDFPIDQPNKGLEGLACVRRRGQTYLLGLSEGNPRNSGTQGREPRRGRIQIFSKDRDRWKHGGTILLPSTVRFKDYSSLSIDGERIAVVSQESSALWVGRLGKSSWEPIGDGAVYRFPHDGKGKILYCNVEGVSWVTSDRVVVVSDKAKGGTQHRRCQAKDESIHIFAIPCPR